MRKKILIILLIIILSFIFLISCSGNDSRVVIAKIDNEKIFKSQFNIFWQNVKEQYNITEEVMADEQYSENITNLRNNVLNSIVDQHIVQIELESLGFYDLSEAEHNTAITSKDSVIEQALSSKQEEMMAELDADYTEKDLAKIITKYTQIVYDELGMNEKELIEYYIDDMVLQNAKRELVNIIISDADIAELYDEYIERDKELFEDDYTAYEYLTMQSGYLSYYIPSGIRNVRHILIKFDDDTVSEIKELRSTDEKKADELVAKSLLTIQDKADEALAFLRDASITMDEAIDEYNDDPGMNANSDGYAIAKDSTAFMPAFTAGGMSLDKVGDISDLVVTDYGYHIIEYYSDFPAGAVELDSVYSTLFEELTAQRNQEAWYEQIKTWSQKYEIEFFYEKLIEKE